MDLSVLQELDLGAITDPGTRRVIQSLLNLIEALLAENQALRATVQEQRDEINRLKGEQGKPDVKPNVRPPGGSDVSSERERRQPRRWEKGRKLDRLVIDRTEVLRVDRAALPPDASFRGYDEVVVQDLVVQRDTVRFRKEVWYSTARAPAPAGRLAV